MSRRRIVAVMLLTFVSCGALESAAANAAANADGRFLYVAVPGIRDYLEYGGHGLLVFDMDHGHRFVKRIPMGGLSDQGKPLNVKGICASDKTGRLYVSTTASLICFDLHRDQQLWERAYEGGCDRMAMAPDGTNIYLPSLEQDHWHVVDAKTGNVLAKIVPKSGAHNTVYGLNGKHVYLAGLRSPWLTVADTTRHATVEQVGPFSNSIRPFTVNGRQTLCFACVNALLGFEIGDLQSGKMIYRVEIQGFQLGPIKRHGCPSHGIGLTPDETEVWVSDAANQRLHVFDATTMPPTQQASIQLKDEPGWVTFSLDGSYAYPSTGEVIDVKTRTIVTNLADETGAAVQSEKMVEVQFRQGRVSTTGDQFGLGRVTAR